MYIDSSRDRRLLALPTKLGGMGIPIFSQLCEKEYDNSRSATQQLRANIQSQVQGLDIDRNREREAENNIRKDKTQFEKEELAQIRSTMTKEELRANDVAQQKGASAWLNALPLQDEGYVLSKREFFDAVTMRYQWPLKRLPLNCACGGPPPQVHPQLSAGFSQIPRQKMRDLADFGGFWRILADFGGIWRNLEKSNVLIIFSIVWQQISGQQVL